MDEILNKLPDFVERIRAVKETVIANIVLIGQIPAPTFKEKHRARFFLERLAELHVDECTFDGYRNPIGIIRGTASQEKPPIFVVAHIDTSFPRDIDHNFVVKENTIQGAGILDNSVGVGVLASLPGIFRRLGLRFASDIVLVGAIQSIGKGNLRGIRHLLKTWSTPIRGAVCIEGGDLGRLNYNTAGMIRLEIECKVAESPDEDRRFKPNAILILNEVINQILELRLPQKPRSRVIIGKIDGGLKHGTIAYDATLGLEIQSDADKMVRKIFNDLTDIVNGAGYEHGVDLTMRTISNLNASRLGYNHPLVKSVIRVMTTLGLKPVSTPSESELSIFLSHRIPAVTLGITHGRNRHHENASIEIDPIFKGIAQIVGVVMAIDKGVCDD